MWHPVCKNSALVRIKSVETSASPLHPHTAPPPFLTRNQMESKKNKVEPSIHRRARHRPAPIPDIRRHDKANKNPAKRIRARELHCLFLRRIVQEGKKHRDEKCTRRRYLLCKHQSRCHLIRILTKANSIQVSSHRIALECNADSCDPATTLKG